MALTRRSLSMEHPFWLIGSGVSSVRGVNWLDSTYFLHMPKMNDDETLTLRMVTFVEGEFS